MDSTRNPVAQQFDTIINAIATHKRTVLAGLIIILVGVGSYAGYRIYKKQAQVAAHKGFMEALKYYDAPVSKTASTDETMPSFTTDQEKWEKVEQVFNDGYQKYKGSKLGSMFLAFQSEALINLGKLDEAINVLKDALPKMSSEPIADYYRVKLSLMQLDSPSKQDNAEGIERLKMMTFDTKSVAHDQALYQLGEYYWTHSNFEEARNYWQQFMVKYGNDTSFEAQLREVQSKLDLIAL